MLLFVEHEQSFDRFHAQSGQIYRLTELQKFDGTEAQVVPLSMWQMAPMFQKDYPEIKNTVRVRALDVVVLKAGERQISSETVLQVNTTFLSVFDFPVLTGNAIAPLRDVSGMVLSAAMAHKLFGTSEVTGKIVEVNRGEGFQTFKVSAVLKDVPENSHLQFEALLPMHEMGRENAGLDGSGYRMVVASVVSAGQQARQSNCRPAQLRKPLHAHTGKIL